MEPTIDIAEEFYIYVGARSRKVKRRPPAKPFDLADCLDRFSQLKQVPRRYEWNFPRAEISPSLSREEAHFWAEAFRWAGGQRQKPADVAQALKDRRFDGHIDDADLYSADQSVIVHCLPPEAAIVLATLRPLDTIVDLLTIQGRKWTPANTWNLLVGFRRFVLPYLAESECEHLRKRVRAAIHAENLNAARGLLGLAAALGMPDELTPIVESWPIPYTFTFEQNENLEFDILLGLRDPELIIHHARRLKRYPQTGMWIKRWIAATGLRDLDFVVDSILRFEDSPQQTVAIRALGLVHAPALAVPMLRIFRQSTTREAAAEWINANVDHTAAGLVAEVEAGSQYAEDAIDMLRSLSALGHREAIDRELDRVSPHANQIREALFVHDNADTEIEPLSDDMAPEPIAAMVKELFRPNLAANDISKLPPILVDTPQGVRHLSAKQLHALMVSLERSTPEKPSPHVLAIKSAVDAESLDRFAWRLFELWLDNGGSAKEKWKLYSVGFLGGDYCAAELIPFLDKWPGQSFHQRAAIGIKCMQMIGTSLSLSHLFEMSLKGAVSSYGALAMDALDAAAADRGISRVELEDRIVPECGLNSRGQRVFDYGKREFKFVLSHESKAQLLDQHGKLYSNLPKAGRNDDLAMIQKASSEWRKFQPLISRVAQTQSRRLEIAMIESRRWRPDEFEQYIVKQPLMSHLARIVLWGVYDGTGQLLCPFRVSEDRTFADVSDTRFEIAPDAAVGIAHPIHLTAAQVRDWNEVFIDYEIFSPFPQLARPTVRLRHEQTDKHVLSEWSQSPVAKPNLTWLEKRYWAGAYGSGRNEYRRFFATANLTAVIEYEAYSKQYLNSEQRITAVSFVQGRYPRKEWKEYDDSRPKWSDVDPIVVSEVLADLMSIAGTEK